MTDRDMLTASRAWSATPHDYSSSISLRFQENGTGVAAYGYGQTIYANIRFEFELPGEGRLVLTYQDSPKLQRFAGFTPTEANRVNELNYTLIDEEQVVVESVTLLQFRFRGRLEFVTSPFPAGFELPHDAPLVYFGNRENLGRLPDDES